MILFSSFAVISSNGGSKDEFYASGCVKSKVIKHAGYYELIKFYETGVVQSVEVYNFSHKKSGTWFCYSEDGVLIGEANFKRGKKHGDWKIYNQEGKMIVYMKYDNGKREIVCTINENNELAIR